MSIAVYCIAYGSKLALPFAFDKQVIDNIQDTTRLYAFEHKITGIMLYKDDNIFQYLEGEKEHVIQLLQTIKANTVYRNITVFIESEKLYSQAQISQHLSDMCNFNK